MDVEIAKFRGITGNLNYFCHFCMKLKIMKSTISILLFILVPLLSNAQDSDYKVATIEHKVPVTAVNISPDGKWILAGMEDGSLEIIDANNYTVLHEFSTIASAAIFDIEMSPKMDVIFLASGSRIMLYDTTGTHIINWPVHRNTMWSMDINRDGSFMVSTEVNKTFQLSNVYEGRIEQSMRAHDDITLAVAFSPDGKTIASGSNDKTVKLWDLETKQVIAEFQGIADNIYDVAFSPDGKYIAAGSRDRTVRIWDIAEGTMVHSLKGHQEMVLEIEYSPDGKYLLSASADQAIKLWDTRSGELIYSFLDNTASVPDIVFLKDGKHFASACMDGELAIRELSPEIFVMKYYKKEMEEEMNANPVFQERRKSEKKQDYESRMERAKAAKEKLVGKYYTMYLEEK